MIVGGKPIAFTKVKYPYWHTDTNGNGWIDPDEVSPANKYTAYTPRLMQAVYNYAFVLRDPLQVSYAPFTPNGAHIRTDLNGSGDAFKIIARNDADVMIAGGTEAAITPMGIGGFAANFIGLAARNRRLFVLPDMIKAYAQLAAESRGEQAAEVVSAQPLTAEQVSALEGSLQGIAPGKQIRIVPKVDPSIIGGLIVKVGSRMIDTSLKTKLTSLKVALKEVR